MLGLTGKSVAPVSPVKYALPEVSSATSNDPGVKLLQLLELSVPPKNVEYRRSADPLPAGTISDRNPLQVPLIEV